MKKAKQRFGLILAAVLVCSLINTPALAAVGRVYVSAFPVEYSLSVDGKNVSLWAYNIEGGVYFGLRDLATALTGTDKQFDVDWNGANNTVLLTTAAAYTPVGGELSKPANPAAAVAYSPTTIFNIDKRQIPIRSYSVNDAHYITLSDLAAHIMFASTCDEEKHAVEINTKIYDTGIYSFSLPEGWSASGATHDLSFSRSDEAVGSFIIRNYDPNNPISQLMDNHRMTLSSENLSGFDYPAAKAVIRATRPAAAHDDSYVDELHLYIMLADIRCAFDFYFDSAKVDEQAAMEIVKSFHPKEAAIKLNTAASQWAHAIQNRDGRAQHELLSTKLKSEFYDFYEATNWVTGVSSPWVNSFTVEITDNHAVVFYEGMTSEGFAGYTIDNLYFSEENGQLKISGIDGYNNFVSYNPSVQGNVPLPEAGVLLAGLPDDHIFIYGDQDRLSKYGGLYEGLYLSINGVNKYFPWESIMNESFAPRLILEDISGEGQKELVVILTVGEGTGVNLSDIHVIEPENFKETHVMDPLDIIVKNVDSSIVHENGAVTITITVSGQKSVITFNEDYAGGWAKDQAVFGWNIIQYSVDGAKLKATVPAQVSDMIYAGEVNITYSFDGTRYVMEAIDFIPYDFSHFDEKLMRIGSDIPLEVEL